MEYFESAQLSDVGRKRKNNEDACWCLPAQGIFCVADGMGGAVGGELASVAITTAVQDVFSRAGLEEQSTLAGRIGLFRRAANQASKWIKDFANEKAIGQMGSTVVALVLDPRYPSRAVGLHAGDSRLYRFHNGDLQLLTADHTAVATLAKKLGRAPASLPPKFQNELVRAVGLKESVELEHTPIEVLGGDLLLLCSDGLPRMVPDKGIAKILEKMGRDPLKAVAQSLIDAANEAGGKDNITVALVKVLDISGMPSAPSDDDDDQAKTIAAPGVSSESDTIFLVKPADADRRLHDDPETLRGDAPERDDKSEPKTPQTVEVTSIPSTPAASPTLAAPGISSEADTVFLVKPAKTDRGLHNESEPLRSNTPATDDKSIPRTSHPPQDTPTPPTSPTPPVPPSPATPPTA